jgi:23S rRNA (cytosine1962-C5)-methyltransferase
MDSLPEILERSLELRLPLLDPQHSTALRLFSGYAEGCPGLTADLYARSLVLTSHAAGLDEAQAQLGVAQECLLARLPWLACCVHKLRQAPDPALRRGRLAFGQEPDREIREQGVRYAVDLLLNQDASFYLDTSRLRTWLHQHAAGWRVLNTFAYTGSLGVAALAGGAQQVVQVDLSGKFLDLARRSAALNHLDWGRQELLAGDFFKVVAGFKRRGQTFDCVLADPPFFSTTQAGRVDLGSQSAQLLNKLRPLVAHGGRLVLVNNALFLSGADYRATLDGLCADGYLALEEIVPVPPDCAGFGPPPIYPADPAPFNHPTKIVILKVMKKINRGGAENAQDI